jgi:transcription elongation GreA/GreB family factor
MAGNICFEIQEALNQLQNVGNAEIQKRDQALQRAGQDIEELRKAGKKQEGELLEAKARIAELENEAIAAKQGFDAQTNSAPKRDKGGQLAAVPAAQ